MRTVHLGTRLAVVALTAAVVAACAASERLPTDPVSPPASFSGSGSVEAPERWWTAFDDPGLNAAVDAALSSNFDLRIAWERLRAAEAVADRTAALGLPAVDALASARTGGPDSEDRPAESFSLDLAASYEVDLWGRIGSRVEAERLRTEATRAEFDAAALTVSAEVARTWAQLAEAASQVVLVDSQIATNATVLELLENRLGAGQVQAVDVLRQRQLLAATREQRTIALERREVLENRLSVLLGQSPGTIQDPGTGPGAGGGAQAGTWGGLPELPQTLPELAPLPDAGVPLELIRRRPDVRSAFLRLRAADRDLAAALSDRFPRLSVSASTATEAGSVGNLFEDWLWSLGGNLLAPLFYGGELQAEVERAEAVRQQRLYAYGQTALTALREVEDALAREARQRERVARIEEQLALARQAYDQLQLQYLNGTTDYLDVLTELDQVQGLSRRLLSSRLGLVEIRIGLYRALAGPIDGAGEAAGGRQDRGQE